MTAHRAALEVDGPDQALRRPGRGQGIGFYIRAGEILGLIGPNGSGKSTVMKLIMGIERPNAGSVQARRHRDRRLADAPHRPRRASASCSSIPGRCTGRRCWRTSSWRCCRTSCCVWSPQPHVETRAREIAERVGLERCAAPPAAHPAVRRSAPAGDGQGDRAQSEGGAGRRAVRRPDRRRGRPTSPR